MSIFSKKAKNDFESEYNGAYDTDYYSDASSAYTDDPTYGVDGNDDLDIEETPKRTVSSYGTNAASGSAFAMKLIKPTSYKEAPAIADHLINRCAVVLNLEAANKETASNLIYFLTGVSYALNGQIKRVAANTYMLAPENMEISEEPRKPEAESAPTQDASYLG